LNQVTTTDKDGAIISIATESAHATISFGRKNGLPNYSNEEMTVFLPVDLDGVDMADTSAIEKALVGPTATIKAFVYQQLGVGFEVKNDVVVGEVPTETPKASTRKGGSKAKPAAAEAVDKDDLWGQLAGAAKNGDNWKTQSGETVWDNREGKRNPKAPDYKFADSGEGLWLDRAPAWFNGAGEGITL